MMIISYKQTKACLVRSVHVQLSWASLLAVLTIVNTLHTTCIFITGYVFKTICYTYQLTVNVKINMNN